MNERADVAVAGGGAAGFFAAVAAAQAAPAARVVILEAAGRVLGKVAISGGGRCNVTAGCLSPADLVGYYPRGGRELRGPFSRFGPRETIAWFEERGVPLKTEPDGRVFPRSDRSASIVDCLTSAARSAGVAVRTGASVVSAAASADGFALRLRDGEKIDCRLLLLATGGGRGGMALAESLGHRIVPPVPSLFALRIDDARLAGLAGVSVADAQLRLADTRLAHRGPLLVTHTGLSGPAVLGLSAWGARLLAERDYRATLRVNWCAGLDQQAARAELVAQRAGPGGRLVSASPPRAFDLPRRLWQRLVESADVGPADPWAALGNAALARLVRQLTDARFEIRGRSPFKAEFVTCGGVRLAEVDFATMASRRCPGLYLAGELLDIDALTGGYNFQSAWTTGWLAGCAIGAALSA